MNVKASRWRTVAFCSTCWSNKEKETRSVQYKERTLVQCHCIAWCNPLTHCPTAYAYYQHLFNVIFFLKLLLTKIMAKYVRWLQQHSVSVLWILICSVINIAVSNCASAGIETFAWCLMLIVDEHTFSCVPWNTSSRIVSLLNEIGEVISIVRAVKRKCHVPRALDQRQGPSDPWFQMGGGVWWTTEIHHSYCEVQLS